MIPIMTCTARGIARKPRKDAQGEMGVYED
jgi:hypothetical protein